MIFVVLWSVIFTFLAIYLGRSPKVRGWLKLLGRNRRIWRVTIATVAIIAIPKQIAAILFISLSSIFLIVTERNVASEKDLTRF